MKKAVGYLIPFMEKEREELMSQSAQDLVSLWEWRSDQRVPRSAHGPFSLEGRGLVLKNTNQWETLAAFHSLLQASLGLCFSHLENEQKEQQEVEGQ